MAHWLLFYDYVGDYLERRTPLREEHFGLARDAHERGELVMAGALAEPPDKGILVFEVDDPGVIEAFVARDPYVREGLVESWSVRPWTVVIGADR